MPPCQKFCFQTPTETVHEKGACELRKEKNESHDYILMVIPSLSAILTSAASRFCWVTGVTIEEAADLSGLSEDWRGRQEPFPKGG